MRTSTECREAAVVAGTSATALGTKAESLTRESYHVAHTWQTPERNRETIFERSEDQFETNAANLLRSMLPPLTTHTILPLPALPLSPAATAQAAAPSQIK